MKGLLGKKVGMTHIFNEEGEFVPVTVIEAGPCVVLQVKTEDKEGYNAIQLGFGAKREKSTTKPLHGHFAKAKSEPKAFVREFRTDGAPEQAIGDEVNLSVLEGCKIVDVVGRTKGRGFTGVMKRWNFHGFPATHGTKTHHRHPGSIGQSAYPSRVLKGVKMAGQYGNEQVTSKNLKVVKIDVEHHMLLVKGAVPGPNGRFVVIQEAGSAPEKKK